MVTIKVYRFLDINILENKFAVAAVTVTTNNHKSLNSCNYYPVCHGIFFPIDNYEFYKTVNQICRDHTKRHPNESRFAIWLSPIHLLVINYRPDSCKEVCLDPRFQNKSFNYSVFDSWLGTGLLTSGDGKWKERRRMITPTFHFNILSQFSSIMNNKCIDLVDRIDKMIGHNDSVEIDIFPLVCNMTLDTISEAAMGKCVNAQDDEENEYVSAVKTITRLSFNRQKKWYYNSDFIYNLSPEGRRYKKLVNYAKQFTLDVIKSRMTAEIATTYDKKLAFLDLLISKYNEGEIDIEGIREEVDTFMFEGHDTTAAAISFCTWLLAKTPLAQEKLVDEIKNFNPQKSKNLNLELEDLKNFNYTDLCMTETLRIFPSVPLIGRKKKDWNENNVVFTIMMCFLGIDESNWENPYDFLPERHLKETNSFASIPFSIGSRNCVGQRFAKQEIATAIIYLFTFFKFETDQGFDDLRISTDTIIRPDNGARVKVSRR